MILISPLRGEKWLSEAHNLKQLDISEPLTVFFLISDERPRPFQAYESLPRLATASALPICTDPIMHFKAWFYFIHCLTYAPSKH